ncbi:MAG: hypothetical protein JNL87_22910 [Burkholderiaceae bacterium]|nr:hypothetical protein [Burkholderiaceae bacterium]
MTLTSRLARAALITSLAGAASLCVAQGTPATTATVSPAKKAQVQKVLQLQQSGIENIGNALANQTANQVMQVAGQALARMPADKRESMAAELQADVRKFHEEIAPMLRAGAVKLAPSTLGAALEEKFSEDELKVLIAWLESPVNRKYGQLAAESQQALGQKLVAETRPQIDPKLKALEQQMGARLNAAGGGASAPAAAAAPRPAASGAKK